MSEMQGYSDPTSVDTAERRTTQIDSEMLDLRSKIVTVQDLVNTLEHRLVPALVVNDSGDKVVPTLIEPHTALVPLAEQLYDFNYQLDATTVRLRSILDRLEL